MSTEQREFDSHKYVALVYDHLGVIRYRFESDSPSALVSLAADAHKSCVEFADGLGENSSLPIWDTYTRDRDVRKMVEEAYAMGLAEGKAAQ